MALTNSILRSSALAGAMVSASAALGDPIFFDDFNGDALLPHWGLPHPLEWSYNVSSGMLNVTGLFNPSSPGVGGNIAGMGALFAAQTDFRVDVWMGWEAVQLPHRLVIEVGGIFNGSPNVASFGYRNDGVTPFPAIVAGASNQAFAMPVPEPGIHQFTIVRTGTRFDFLFDGSPFWSVTDIFGSQAAAIGFEFVGPFPGALSPFHIDRVVVVPSPSGILLLLAAPCIAALRTRR